MRVMRTNPVRTDTREATWDISARDIKRDDKSIMAAKTCKKMVNMYHNHMYICRLVDLAMISKIAMARSAMVKHRDLRSDGDGLKTIFFLLKTLDTWSFKLCLKHKKRCISNKNLETAEIIRIIGYETLLYYGV